MNRSPERIIEVDTPGVTALIRNISISKHREADVSAG